MDYGGSKAYTVSDSSSPSANWKLLRRFAARGLKYYNVLADIKCGPVGHAGHFDHFFKML